MTKFQTTEFDNEMKTLAQGVYKGNGNLINTADGAYIIFFRKR